MVKKRKIKKKHTKDKKSGKELFWILGFIVFLVLVFMVSSAFFKNLKTFEYEGLTFTKKNLEGIPLYHYYYLFENNGHITKYNVYFRYDPRKADIPVEGGEISFLPKKFVYLTFNASDFEMCPQAVLGILDISDFIQNNQYDLRVATLDKNDTELNFRSCDIKPGNPVIELIASSNGTRIVVEDLCYRIYISDCEILQAAERFKLQAILDGKDRAERT